MSMCEKSRFQFRISRWAEGVAFWVYHQIFQPRRQNLKPWVYQKIPAMRVQSGVMKILYNSTRLE